MALQIKRVNIVGAGIGVSLGTVDSVVVGPGVLVASSGTMGISGDGANHQASIYGSVFAATVGVFLGNDATNDHHQRLYVGAEGDLWGGTQGARIVGHDSRVYNHGSIHGENAGLVLSGVGTGDTLVYNYGTIHSAGTGISRQGTGDTESLTISNFGRISGDSFSYNSNGANAIDKVFNRGSMIGTIDLGLGNDLYDGRGGKVFGSILGGAGNDFFLLGTSAEAINGGTGTDVLDCRYFGGVIIALDGSLHNAGAAAGDTFTGIESVVGSNIGNDTLVGNSLANELVGLGGSDLLSGGSGNDTLSGGVAVDRMIGGLGNDFFDYFSLADAGDKLLDFTNVFGNDDTIRINTFSFGGNLGFGALAASQFQSRADNLAQDANDRFIFRITDKTLWFDNNGSAAGGLLLVADLQAGATLTAADIVLI